MASRRSVTEVARNFAGYLNRVAYRGETFVLVKGGKPLAELRPLAMGRRLSELPALLAALPLLTKGEAARFSKDLDAGRRKLKRMRLREPWPS